ncbi:MAG: hypothetical protein C4576_09065 [Desulfobacteraceae bacterium]|nr:MAG: hypothetical protein C4576_09065 [Desulfobacteraceae bacterium]
MQGRNETDCRSRGKRHHFLRKCISNEKEWFQAISQDALEAPVPSLLSSSVNFMGHSSQQKQ